MLFDMFFNITGVLIIVGAPLLWLGGWIWLLYKADTFVHKQFEPPPYVPTPEEKAASLARVRKMIAETERSRLEAAHHH
jgi:hypothetical protein